MPALKSTATGYGYISIALHWLMAVGIYYMFGLGLYMIELTYYDSWYHGSLAFHKGLGILLALALVARVIWRIFEPSPKPVPGPKWEQVSALLMHKLLYLALLSLFVSGYLISTADGRAIDVFGWFDVPSLGSFVKHQTDVAGKWHKYNAWLLIFLSGFHALAALKHHFIDKDTTLKRMLGLTNLK